jgi:hypothetical protein
MEQKKKFEDHGEIIWETTGSISFSKRFFFVCFVLYQVLWGASFAASSALSLLALRRIAQSS